MFYAQQACGLQGETLFQLFIDIVIAGQMILAEADGEIELLDAELIVSQGVEPPVKA